MQAAAAMQVIGGVTKTIATVQARDVAAKQLEQEAVNAQNRSIEQQQQSERESALVSGKANAITAASGLSLRSGTPLFMELDRAKQSAIESLSIKQAGDTRAANLRFERRLQKRAIPFDILGGFMSTASSATSAYGAGK